MSIMMPPPSSSPQGPTPAQKPSTAAPPVRPHFTADKTAQVDYLRSLAGSHRDPEAIEAIVQFVNHQRIPSNPQLLPRMLHLLLQESLDTLLSLFMQQYPFGNRAEQVLQEVQAKFASNSNEFMFLQRIINACQSLCGVDKYYHNLDPLQVFRIAAFAELKILQGSTVEVEHVRKLTPQGRSLIIDYKNKEWAILSKSKKGVDFLLSFGSDKKVTSAIQVDPAKGIAEIIAELVNRPGKILNKRELAIANHIKASGQTRGLALFRLFAEYTSKRRLPKQALTQTRYISCAYDLFNETQAVRAKEKVPFPDPTEREIQQMALEVAHGLNTLHSLGYAHGDLKLENILARYVNGRWEFAISDFGYTFRPATEPAQGGGVYGTYFFSSPETVRHWLSTHSLTGRKGMPEDIYAFGIMLYIARTKNFPPWVHHYKQGHPHAALQLQDQHVHEITWLEGEKARNIIAGTHTPADELDLLMHQCLHPDPKQRPNIDAVLRIMNSITQQP